MENITNTKETYYEEVSNIKAKNHILHHVCFRSSHSAYHNGYVCWQFPFHQRHNAK